MRAAVMQRISSYTELVSEGVRKIIHFQIHPTMSSEKSEESKGKEVLTREPSVGHGELGVVDDQEVSDFYGSSVSDSYRLKSE
ncbi:hypothetical protein FJTKL_09140 [Diaporthe vaccinii]|uniref:Uncharacterized protein n=1 Tax=Diaporthe vaccinii TaxID=105482 RepID=A0ABR4EP08_9PEZI